MVNIQQPKLPSGGASDVAKTAAKDFAGVAYVGLVGAAGLGLGLYLYRKGRDAVKAKASTTTETAASLFTMG